MLEITHEKLEEMILCIVQCDLNEGEPLEYANAVMLEFNNIEIVEPDIYARIDAIEEAAKRARIYRNNIEMVED